LSTSLMATGDDFGRERRRSHHPTPSHSQHNAFCSFVHSALKTWTAEMRRHTATSRVAAVHVRFELDRRALARPNSHSRYALRSFARSLVRSFARSLVRQARILRPPASLGRRKPSAPRTTTASTPGTPFAMYPRRRRRVWSVSTRVTATFPRSSVARVTMSVWRAWTTVTVGTY